MTNEGDPYPNEVEASVRAIRERLGWTGNATLAYQSKLGPVEWLGPPTLEVIRELGRRKEAQVLVVPIAFVTDHVETLQEIDQLFAGEAAAAGIGHFRRTPGLNDRPTFLRALAELALSVEVLLGGMTRRSLVVGAGLSGLAAAHALARRGQDVLVLEASEGPGGAVRTRRLGGFLLELGPNTVRPNPELRALIAELSLSNEAVYADRGLPRFIDWNGRLHRAPLSPGALLSTRLLSPSGKLRLLREPFVPRGDASAESLAEFVARRLGREAAERLVEPFVGGVFAGSADRLSARDAFPALVAWEAEHGSLFAGNARRAAPGGRRARPRTAARCFPFETAWRRCPARSRRGWEPPFGWPAASTRSPRPRTAEAGA